MKQQKFDNIYNLTPLRTRGYSRSISFLWLQDATEWFHVGGTWGAYSRQQRNYFFGIPWLFNIYIKISWG